MSPLRFPKPCESIMFLQPYAEKKQPAVRRPEQRVHVQLAAAALLLAVLRGESVHQSSPQSKQRRRSGDRRRDRAQPRAVRRELRLLHRLLLGFTPSPCTAYASQNVQQHVRPLLEVVEQIVKEIAAVVRRAGLRFNSTLPLSTWSTSLLTVTTARSPALFHSQKAWLQFSMRRFSCSARWFPCVRDLSAK